MNWDHSDAFVFCYQLGLENGYLSFSPSQMEADATPDAPSGVPMNFWKFECQGLESTLEEVRREMVEIWFVCIY